MPFVEHYDAWAIIAVFFTSVFYAVNYLVKTRLACLHSEVGLSRISLDLSVAVAVFPGLLFRFFHIDTATPFWEWYVAVGLTMICLAGIWNVWVLYRVNQRAYWNRLRARWEHRLPESSEGEGS